MSDARLKLVYERLVPLVGETHFALDLVHNATGDIRNGEIIEIPSISDLTVTASGTTGASGQSVTPNVLTLTVDRDPAIFVNVGKLERRQTLNGEWAQQLAEQCLVQLKLDMEEDLLEDYLIREVCYDTSATYHDNVAAATLTPGIFLNSRAGLAAQGGAVESRFALFVNPYGAAAIQAVAGFIPNGAAAEQGFLGIPRIGALYGTPVYQTKKAPRNRTIAATASAIASNVITLTVPSGHGVVPGMKITTAGATADIDTAAAVSSVTATTIVAPLTASDDASNGACTITIDSCENLLVDLGMVHVAQQLMPHLEIVKMQDTTKSQIQVSSGWGRVARTGYARVLHTASTVS